MSLFNSSLGEKRIREILNRHDVHIHFLGIAGAGNAPLAELLANKGVRVSGTDRSGGERLNSLSALSVITDREISDSFLPDAVVYSLAIGEDDRELNLAISRGIPLISRAELLGVVMSDYKCRIGVAGTHGKSTTTAMIHSILDYVGRVPTTLSGAALPGGRPLSLGEKEFFIFEACEYKDSFLCMCPTVSVITNIELDHTDYFKSEEQLVDSFTRFANRADVSVINYSDKISRTIYPSIRGARVTFGNSSDAAFSYTDVEFSDTGTTFSLLYNGKREGRAMLSTLGLHNVSNATCAIAAASSIGIDINSCISALRSFSGIERRLELLGSIGNRSVFYDYAHHPTEIMSTLRALRSVFGEVTCIFRPHTYSRTAALWDGFVEALSSADYSVLLDIYPAREEPMRGINSESLAAAIGDRCVYLDFNDAVCYCLKCTTGAIVLMGAGEVDIIKKELNTRINNTKED